MARRQQTPKPAHKRFLPVAVCIPPAQIEMLVAMGDGNQSAGLRKILTELSGQMPFLIHLSADEATRLARYGGTVSDGIHRVVADFLIEPVPTDAESS